MSGGELVAGADEQGRGGLACGAGFGSASHHRRGHLHRQDHHRQDPTKKMVGGGELVGRGAMLSVVHAHNLRAGGCLAVVVDFPLRFPDAPAFCLPLLAAARPVGALPAKSSRGRPLAPGFWV